ncbi:response regulator [Noviherbaspirillum soli]|uniref:response regulator n=1 Tax=Noviherbaspirillum soli TaxID=1064518 RepID=UPI001E6408CC|nr:response regulator [Noviherbaspirillum soli]
MPCHLLLIEDDHIASYVTQKVLKQCGFAGPIDVVQDGQEALEYLACEGRYAKRATGNPSLIVLDLKLPNTDGFEVLKHIRSTPMLVEIPVFILSASRSQEDVYRSNLLGISKYLVKPLSVSEFSPEVIKIMAGSKDDASLAR